jgi:hypothetical protein
MLKTIIFFLSLLPLLSAIEFSVIPLRVVFLPNYQIPLVLISLKTENSNNFLQDVSLFMQEGHNKKIKTKNQQNRST